MSKGFWAVIAIIVVIVGGILLFGNKDDGNGGGKASGAQPTNHVEGSTKTGVKLVEYGDYQCPYCGQFYPIVKQVTDKYKDQIQFQFRNLPLSQIHKNGFAGARAAEAAAIQGKFWEMHDKLYENQDPNGQTGWVVSNDPLNQYFVNFATSVGVKDIAKFKQDFASSAVNNTINADIAEYDKTGLEKSTPAFFIDGKKINPSYSVDDFSKTIEAAIKAKAGK